MKIEEYLKSHILIMDGAMGTYYERKYPQKERYAEFANDTDKEAIINIHKEYIDAGAKLICTNTFASNHILFPDWECQKENIIHGIEAAKKAVEETGKEVFVAASIGPIRNINDEEDVQDEKIAEEYKKIADIFLSQGIDIFVFETFVEESVLHEIAAYIKEKKKDSFVLVQFSLTKTGYTSYGLSMQKILSEITKDVNINGVGFNCGMGSTHLANALKQARFTMPCILSAVPNAGYGHDLRGRRIWTDNSEYYIEQMTRMVELGVNIIGGCCGTTPQYIRRLVDKFDSVKPYPKEICKIETKESYSMETPEWIRKLERGEEKVYAVELDPPFQNKPEKLIEGAIKCEKEGIDVITLADSPMGKSRADSVAMSILLGQKIKTPIMPHLCCRDRNMISLRSTVLGAQLNEIRQMLIITGDPVSRADKENVTSVFDMNSIRFMQYIKDMNQEMFQQKSVFYGGALNYAGANVDAIVKRMEKKMEAGCSYFLTQPIYSDEDIERVVLLKKRTNAKILAGIMPLVSYKNARFMQQEMPGIHVPQTIVDQYEHALTREENEEIGLKIAVEIARKIMDSVDGFYFMVPFNRVDFIHRIIREVKKYESKRI